MQELIAVAQFIQNYMGALGKAIDTTAIMLPSLVRQHIETQANTKLSTSRDEYLSALSVKMEDYVLVMEIDEKNWLACAVEKGASGWDMKNPPNGGGHLRSSKAKVSKKGFRYAHVPIGKSVGGKPGPSEKSKEIQQKINEVMKRPSFKSDKMGGTINKLYTKMGNKYQPGVFPGGPIVQTQQIETGMDKDISGLYRTRVFADAESYYQKQQTKVGMPKWNLLMFRTISENPFSSNWIHPGITGINLLKQTKDWTYTIVETLLEENIRNELRSVGVM